VNWLPGLFENFLRDASAGNVTGIFFTLIIAFFLTGVICYRKDSLRSLTHYTPNLLTSLGMLGTFIGIVIGLLHFDPDNIDGSISLLLGGLQTAFMTSLFGMGMTILYKFLTSMPQMQPQTDLATGPEEIGPEHIHQLLREQNDNLNKLRHAIAGDDSDTLMGQIRLMRQSQDDGQQRLVRETSRQAEAAEGLSKHAETQRLRFDEFARELSQQMHDFADMMSKSATEQVINALKEVIKDFNQKLTEQFGKNFEELNDAVKLMVEWQENYRQQLGEMRDQYAQGVTAITQTEASVAHISDKATSIPKTMEGLETLLNATQRQLEDLQSHLAAFSDIRDRAVEAVPEIRRQIDETVNEINQAAQTAARDLVEGSGQMRAELVEGSARINQEMIEGATGLNERYNRVHESLQGTSDQLSEQSQRIAEHFRDAHEEVNNHIRELVGTLTKGSEIIGNELSSSAEHLGARFVEMQTTLEGNASSLNEGAKRLSEEYKRGIEGAEEQVRALVDRLSIETQQLARTLGESGEETQQQLRQVQSRTSEALETLQTQHQKALTEANQQYQQQLSNAYQQVESAMQQAVQRTGDHVNAQMERIDDSMQQELQRVMTEMGSALGQISGRFTQDYQKLTGEMQKIVQSVNTSSY